jgi:hypothetical protein
MTPKKSRAKWVGKPGLATGGGQGAQGSAGGASGAGAAVSVWGSAAAAGDSLGDSGSVIATGDYTTKKRLLQR